MNEHDRNRLQHMVDEAHRVQKFVSGKTKQAFLDDVATQYAVIHALQIVGEAASRITKETQEKYSQIAWRGMIGLRNVVVHGYTDVEPERIWDTVQTDVPVLIEQLQSILKTDLADPQ